MIQAARVVPSPAATLPRPIRRVLGRIGRRLVAAAVLRGAGTVALVAAAGAALGMAADFAGVVPGASRWATWGAWLAALTASAVVGLLRPLGRVLGAGPLDLAALAERTHPGLDERLTGAVALLGTRDEPPHGAPALIAALAGSAAASAARVDPARVVPLRRPARRAATGLVAVGLVVAATASWPATVGVLARRFLAPWADLDPVGPFVLTVTPGDRVAAIGSDLTVRARVRPRPGIGMGYASPPGSAWLEWAEGGGGAWQRSEMPAEAIAGPEHAFALTLPQLAGDLAYRVRTGRVASRTFRIRAVERPAVAMLSATVEPPAYTKLPARSVADPGRIEAWEGSRVTLEIRASRPVASIAVDWPSPAAGADAGAPGNRGGRVAAVLGADGTRWTATVAAEASGTFAVTLRDAHGLDSTPEPGVPRRLVVRPDAAPALIVSGVGAETETETGTVPATARPQESSPDDVLAPFVAASDDVAVASVELHYAIGRGGTSTSAAGDPMSGSGHVDIYLPGLGTRAARGVARLELASLGLRPGDTLRYRVRAADNRPSPRGPNVTWSPARSLAIVARAEPLEARRVREGRDRVRSRLDALEGAAAENRRETQRGPLRDAADAQQRGDDRWGPDQQRALERREAEAHRVADRLQLLARDLAAADDDALRDLSGPSRRAAEDEAEPGRALLEQAVRDADPARRLDDLRRADRHLASVVRRLDDLRRQFDALPPPPRDPAPGVARGPGPAGGDPGEAPAGPGTPDPSEIEARPSGTTGRAWGELPGHLRSAILPWSQGRYRDDYARLIQLYFRDIAAGAEKPGPR